MSNVGGRGNVGGGGGGFSASAIPSGYFYKSANTASLTTMTTIDTWYKTAGTTVLKSAASNMITMPSNNRLTYTGSKDFVAHVTTTISYLGGSGWQGLNLAHFLNGSIEQSTDRITMHQHSANLKSEATVTSKFVMSTDDYIELWSMNDLANSTTYNIYTIAMNLSFEGWA